MAHIKVYRTNDGRPHLELNGLDISDEVYFGGMRIVSTGHTEFDEVCVELKIGLSRLDIGDNENVDAALLIGAGLINMARPADAADVV